MIDSELIDPDLIDTVAFLIAEEHHRFESERQRLEGEIRTLRMRLTEAQDYAQTLVDEADGLRERVKRMECPSSNEVSPPIIAVRRDTNHT